MKSRWIRTLTIIFDTEISSSEIPLFRGAMLNALGDGADEIFHNHSAGNNYRYSYPLIQYKRLGGRASIVCVDEAVDCVGQLLTMLPHKVMIGQREAALSVKAVHPARMLMQLWQSPMRYHLSRWLPLNTTNYQRYQSMENLSDRITLLEGILCGNMLSMLKGIGITLEEELKVKINEMGQPYIRHNKGVSLLALNVDITTNLSLPNNIGIGKNASIGYGIVHRINESPASQTSQEYDDE